MKSKHQQNPLSIKLFLALDSYFPPVLPLDFQQNESTINYILWPLPLGYVIKLDLAGTPFSPLM